MAEIGKTAPAEQAAPAVTAPAKRLAKPASFGVTALHKVASDVYVGAWEAKKAGRPVGWSSSKFPCEIAEVLDLAVVYPENQVTGIAAQHDGERLYEAAENLGFDADICGYARISLAYASGVKTTNVSRQMPWPDFVLYCNNICSCMTKWYGNIARMHNIPLIMIDVPYNNTTHVDENQVTYIRAQFEDAIKQLEKISGNKFDEKKSEQVCANADHIAKAWLKARGYCQYELFPMSGFDLFNHMVSVATTHGKESTTEASELLAIELEEHMKNGTSTLPFEERYRIMFEGIPCWPDLKALFKPLKGSGLNVTAVVYAPVSGLVYDGPDDLYRAHCKTPNSVCLEQGVERREGLCRDNKVDGVLAHYNRSCKPWSGHMPEMQRRSIADLGIPCAAFSGDQVDPRNLNAAQYETRVQGLVEAMEATKAVREG